MLQPLTLVHQKVILSQKKSGYKLQVCVSMHKPQADIMWQRVDIPKN